MQLDNWQIKDVNGTYVPVKSEAYKRSLFWCEACGLVVLGPRYNWRRGLCAICDAALPEGAEPCAVTLPETTPDERPLVAGGQGRSAEDVLFSAWVVFWCVVGIIVCGAAAWVCQWMGWR